MSGRMTEVRHYETFAAEIFYGCFRGAKQIGGNMIRQNAIDFFRHPFIEASKARLHVRYGKMELGSGQGGTEGGIRVAVHHDDIRFLLIKDIFRALLNKSRLLTVAAGPHIKVIIWGPDAQLVKKDL